MKIVKSHEDSGLFKRFLAKQFKMEQNYRKGGLLGMLLGTLVASLLGNMFTGKK